MFFYVFHPIGLGVLVMSLSISMFPQKVRVDSLIRDISALVAELESEITLFNSSGSQSSDLDMRFSDENLILNDKIFPLGHRPLTRKLVQSFMESEDFSLTKDDLISKVYLDGKQSLNKQSLSPRLSISLYQNLLKLLSRARALFSSVFNVDSIGLKIEWFVYDSRNQIWKFYQIVED